MSNKKYQYENWHLTSKVAKNIDIKSDFHKILFWSLVILSPFLFCFGLFVIFNPSFYLDEFNLSIIACLGVIILLFIYIIAPYTNNNYLRSIIVLLLILLSSYITYNFFPIVAFIFRIVTALLGLVISGFMFTNIWRNLYDKLSWFRSFSIGFIYLIINLYILFGKYSIKLLAILTGVYITLFALSFIFEGYIALFSKKKNTVKSFILTLPTFFTAFLPGAIFRELNMLVRKDPHEILEMQEPSGGREPDAIIYVHTRPGYIRDLGHCDIVMDGKVYSFGDYDRDSWRLGGYFSDGVMAIIEPQKQIEMALGDNKKMLVAYGLILSPEQKKILQDTLNSVMEKSYPWKSKAQLATKEEIKKDPSKFVDSGSQMYLESGCSFYKFKEKSPYRIYCGTNLNCATFVNDVLSSIGLKLFRFTDIISPGNIFLFIDEIYLTNKSVIKDKRLYSLDENGEPVEYPSKPAKPFNYKTG